MSILEFLAGRLRELRCKHDLTQDQVAMLLGTDLRWYQRIESKTKDIRASTIDRLAGAFGISGVELMAAAMPDSRVTGKPHRAPHRPMKKTPAKKQKRS